METMMSLNQNNDLKDAMSEVIIIGGFVNAKIIHC